MINPYVQGPMKLTGFTWYQGEANTANQATANQYACLFPAMIQAWRKKFQVPDAYFGFVQCHYMIDMIIKFNTVDR